MLSHTCKKMWFLLAALPLLGLGSCLLNAADWYSYYAVDEFIYEFGYYDDGYYADYYDDYYADDYYDDCCDWW